MCKPTDEQIAEFKRNELPRILKRLEPFIAVAVKDSKSQK